MTLWALLLPAVASAIGLPASAAPQSPSIAAPVQQWAGQFASDVTTILATVDTAITEIIRAAYVTCILLGILLYYTHIARRLGKDLIIGGALLIVIVELILPSIAGLIG
jgi:hypothetical protein